MPKQIVIHVLTMKAGGGHYATLNAIRAICQQTHSPYLFEVIDMGELFESLDPFNKIFALGADDLYNLIIRSGWTWTYPFLLKFTRWFIKIKHKKGLALLAQKWLQQPPDIVLSVVPFFNLVAWDAIQQVVPKVPMLTLVTDFADNPPNFWFETRINSYWLCGTKRLMEQAQQLNIPSERLFQISGMVVHPRFYHQQQFDIKETFDLNPKLYTAIVSFGAYGSNNMLSIAQLLEPFSQTLQLIFICGHNEQLVNELNQLPGKLHKVVIGFTDNIQDYMQAADFFIGKPGPGSVSEAIVMRLPVIVEYNAFTLLQERCVAEWLQQHQVGIVIKSFDTVASAVETLLTDKNLANYKKRVRQKRWQSIFEIPDLVQKIYDHHQ